MVYNCDAAGIFQTIVNFHRFEEFEVTVMVPLVLTKNEEKMELAAVPNQLGSSIHSPL